MRSRIGTILFAALLCLAPSASWADLAPYSQDFEGLDQQSPSALTDDGWLIFGNVFGPDWSYWYGYGVFGAPNGGAGFSAIDIGQGGPDQGEQQLVVYNDYNNGNHGDGSDAIIEANVFQEQMIGAADVGNTWRFEFDAKRGNIDGATAKAFIKTLDPNDNYAQTNFITADMTNIPDTWDTFALSIDIDAGLAGQLLQIGFVSWSSNYMPSGIFYDNINFDVAPRSVDLDIKPGGCPNPLNRRARGMFPVAVLGAGDFDVNEIDVDSLRLEGVAPVNFGYEDVAGPFAGDLWGCSEAGPDGFVDLTLKFFNPEIVDAVGPLGPGSHVLTLTGMLLDGTEIMGQDCIIVVGGGDSRTTVDDSRKNWSSRGELSGNVLSTGSTVQPLQRR